MLTGKVIPRKDLPKIYTMCVPPEYQTKLDGNNGNIKTSGAMSNVLDLELARNDVVKEVMMAPDRRIDNSLTWLDDSTKLLEMHMRIINGVASKKRSIMMNHWMTTLGRAGFGQAIAAGALFMDAVQIAVGFSSMSLILAGGMHVLNQQNVADKIEALMTDEGLYEIFKREYHNDFVAGDEFVASLWHRAREQIQVINYAFFLRKEKSKLLLSGYYTNHHITSKLTD